MTKEQVELEQLEKTYCVNHPDVETNVHCSNCGRPICTKCMVFTPVGVKCRDCGRPAGRMVHGLKPIYYWRALGAGLGAALVAGVLLAEVARAVRFGGLLLVLFTGFAIAEAVSRGSRRNGGPVFQWMAGIFTFLAFFIAGYVTGAPLLTVAGLNPEALVFQPNPIRLLFAIVGIVVAAARLKD